MKERIVADGAAGWHEDEAQGDGFAERSVTNGVDVVGQGNRDQIPAVHEGLHTDGSEAVGQGHSSETYAATECRVTD